MLITKEKLTKKTYLLYSETLAYNNVLLLNYFQHHTH